MKVKLGLMSLIFWGLVSSNAMASYPTDPTSDTQWPYSSESSVSDIQTRFNTGRSNENSQLGLSIPMLTMPSQAEWDSKSDGEKALWLINRERIDRGVDPLDGVEENVTDVAQYYAQYLMDNNVFGHYEDGNSPWERLDNNPAIGACRDFLNVAENLAVLWGGWTLPVERSVYMWMYEDSGSSWGHRHAILWYPYNDNSGSAGQEGFLGIGVATGTHSGYSNSDIVVMNVFDPCSTWSSVETAEISSPAPGSAFSSTSVTFTWNDSGADKYWLDIGTTGAGSYDVHNANEGLNTSANVENLPNSGETIYVRLWSYMDGEWLYNDYTYTACAGCVNPSVAILQTPAPGSALSSTTVTFTWNNTGAEKYWLSIGTSGAESYDVYNANEGTSTSVSVDNLPNGGETLYTRLWSYVDGDWFFNDYTYTACDGCTNPGVAVLQTPSPGSTLNSTTITFTWNNTGAEKYWVSIGTIGPETYEVFNEDVGSNTSVNVENLPNSGETVYVRIWSRLDGNWLFNDYTYIACDGCTNPSMAVMQNPSPGSALASTTVTFIWNDTGAGQYWLSVGTTGEGSYNVYNVSQGTNTSETVDGLPDNGETVYVRLWTLVSGDWLFYDYTYTAFGP